MAILSHCLIWLQSFFFDDFIEAMELDSCSNYVLLAVSSMNLARSLCLSLGWLCCSLFLGYVGSLIFVNGDLLRLFAENTLRLSGNVIYCLECILNGKKLLVPAYIR